MKSFHPFAHDLLGESSKPSATESFMIASKNAGFIADVFSVFRSHRSRSFLSGHYANVAVQT